MKTGDKIFHAHVDERELEHHITRRQLAKRWGCSTKKIANDFCAGRLPIDTICIGRLRLHRISDVLAHERAQSRRSTSDVGGRHDD